MCPLGLAGPLPYKACLLGHFLGSRSALESTAGLGLSGLRGLPGQFPPRWYPSGGDFLGFYFRTERASVKLTTFGLALGRLSDCGFFESCSFCFKVAEYFPVAMVMFAFAPLYLMNSPLPPSQVASAADPSVWAWVHWSSGCWHTPESVTFCLRLTATVYYPRLFSAYSWELFPRGVGLDWWVWAYGPVAQVFSFQWYCCGSWIFLVYPLLVDSCVHVSDGLGVFSTLQPAWVLWFLVCLLWAAELWLSP